MGEAQERLNWDLEFLINRHLLESPRPFRFSAALAMEDGRYPNVLFRDPDDNQLKLTHWTTGDRVTEVIGESVGDGHRVAAEFDRSGGLHVITTNYGSGDGGSVRYAHRDPVTDVWSYVELEGEGSVECTLALGPDDVPHVAFVRLDNSDAKMVYGREDKKAGEWNLTTLPESAHHREISPALTVDAAGVAHLIYNREDNNLQGGSLEYVRIDGRGAELVGVPPESGSFPAIAHAGGTLRLVYQRFPNSDLVYRTCGEDGEWSEVQIVAERGSQRRYSLGMQIDPLGRPVVFDGAVVRTLAGGVWQSETLPYHPRELESAGRIAADGKRALVFRNARTSSVYNLGVMVEVADRWREEIVAPQSDRTPFACRIAALPDGTPQIFSDAFPDDDELTAGKRSKRQPDGTWEHHSYPYISRMVNVVTGVDGITHGISFIPLDPGAPGRGVWGYVRLDGDTLNFGVFGGGQVPNSIFADPAGLALDSNGIPHMGFITDGSLFIASRPAARWQTEEVAFIRDFATVEVALVFDGSDNPTLATDGKVYQKIGGVWQSVHEFQDGNFVHLAASGDDVFLFYDKAGLNMAHSDAGSPWSTSFIWPAEPGGNFQVAVDPQGCLAIAFEDEAGVVVGRRNPTGFWRFQVHRPEPLTDQLSERLGLDIDQYGRVHVAYIPMHIVDSSYLPTLYYGTEEREVSFGSWIAAARPAGSDLSLDPFADPDFDGQSSFLEYATGGQAFTPGSEQPLRVWENQETGAVHGAFHIPDRVRSVRYRLLSSSDLKTWETIFEYRTHPQETVLTPAGATAKHRFDGVDVHFEIDPASGRNYVRLEASDES